MKEINIIVKRFVILKDCRDKNVVVELAVVPVHVRQRRKCRDGASSFGERRAGREQTGKDLPCSWQRLPNHTNAWNDRIWKRRSGDTSLLVPGGL